MVRFIVDSTFGLSREEAEAKRIETVSLTLLIGDKEYTEGYREDWDGFYADYARSKAAAKTSQPSPDKFVEAIERILAEDENAEIMILTIADRLSGTIGSAKIAAAQYEGRRIEAFNSGEAGPSALLLLREMYDAAAGGATYDELVELLADLNRRIAMQFVPATLTELARGGRVNKLLSKVGNILKIKPVFEFARNELSIYAKTLGLNRALDAAIAHLPEKFDKLFVYYIGSDKNIEPLRDRLFKRFGLERIDIEPMCPVGGVHIGIGTVGIVTLASK